MSSIVLKNERAKLQQISLKRFDDLKNQLKKLFL